MNNLIKQSITFSLVLCTSLLFQACDKDKELEETDTKKMSVDSTGEESSGDDSSEDGVETPPMDMPSSNDCGNTCNVFEQDCPENESCQPKACKPDNQETGIWDTDICAPAGQSTVGEACTRPGEAELETECAKGGMCWGGVCQATCTGTLEDPKCPMDNTCLIGNDGVLAVCLPSCDPLAPACAGPTDVCLPAGDDPDGFICVPKAGGEDDPSKWGDPCKCLNCCEAGLICIDGKLVDKEGCINEELCCAQICDTSSEDACPGAMEDCKPYFDEVKPGYENVGICVIPE